jgi:predicted kinase
MTKKYLFLMLGFPGSGKSYVADWLALHMKAVHLRGDEMRLRMFNENNPELHTWKYQQQVIGAMQYAVGQILEAGYPVIYDSNHNSVKGRVPMHEVARKSDAVSITVWVKAPLELAKERVLERAAQGGMHKVFGIDFVDRMANNLQPPTKDELAIELDGTQTEKEQRASFEKQLAALPLPADPRHRAQ